MASCDFRIVLPIDHNLSLHSANPAARIATSIGTYLVRGRLRTTLGINHLVRGH